MFFDIFITLTMSFSDLSTVCSTRSGFLEKVARLWLPGFAAWNRRAWRTFIRKAAGGVIALRWKTAWTKKMNKKEERSSKEFKVQSQIFKKKERKRKEWQNWNIREVFRHLRSLWLLPLIRRRNLQCLFQVRYVKSSWWTGGTSQMFYVDLMRLGDRVPNPGENHEGWDLKTNQPG